jgi:hypothetical protein
MPMPHPIQYATDDGFETSIAEQPDGSLRVTVSGMVRRMWTGDRATIEEAIALGIQIRRDQSADSASFGRRAVPVALLPEQQSQATDGAAPLDRSARPASP